MRPEIDDLLLMDAKNPENPTRREQRQELGDVAHAQAGQRRARRGALGGRQIADELCSNGRPVNALRLWVAQLDLDWDVVAKMDADLEIGPATIATIEEAFAHDPKLGMAGAHLVELGADGSRIPLAAAFSDSRRVFARADPFALRGLA